MGDVKANMVLSEDEKKDKNVFKQIIIENWEEFKKNIHHMTNRFMRKLSKKQCFAEQSRVDILSIGVWIAERD